MRHHQLTLRILISCTLFLILALNDVMKITMAENATEPPAMTLPAAENGHFALITLESDPMIGPHLQNYQYADDDQKTLVGYSDPSISIRLLTGRVQETNYIAARIIIADPSQLRTMMSGSSLHASSTAPGNQLAKRAQAVIAVNGVLDADQMIKGPLLQQGKCFRPGTKTSQSRLKAWMQQDCVDTLLIDTHGDLHILEGNTWADILVQMDEYGASAANVLSFGPALIVDGQPRYGYANRQMSTHRLAQRMAICQTCPLEYLVITSEGPEDAGSVGLTLDQFTELIASFPEIQTAYNLDGGSSSTLVFRRGNDLWVKINCPHNRKQRSLRDIIYFADAWIPDR